MFPLQLPTEVLEDSIQGVLVSLQTEQDDRVQNETDLLPRRLPSFFLYSRFFQGTGDTLGPEDKADSS